MSSDRSNLIIVQVPSNYVDSFVVHAEVLWTGTVRIEVREAEEDPERSLVTVDAKKRFFLLETSGFQHVVRRVDEKVTVDRRRPGKHLYTCRQSIDAHDVEQLSTASRFV